MGTWPAHVEPFGRIGGQDAVERLMEAVRRRSRHVYDGHQDGMGVVEPPSVAQVGMVLRALADHTSMQQAVTWAPDPTFHPAATSAGRWMHRYADDCEGWHRERERLRAEHVVSEPAPIPGREPDEWLQVHCSCGAGWFTVEGEASASAEVHLDLMVRTARDERAQVADAEWDAAREVANRVQDSGASA